MLTKPDYPSLQLVQGIAKGMLVEEARKHASIGCSLENYPEPVSLEPLINPINSAHNPIGNLNSEFIVQALSEKSWLQLLPQPDQNPINLVSLFTGIPEISCFEIFGNQGKLAIQMGIPSSYETAVTTLLKTQKLSYLHTLDQVPEEFFSKQASIIEMVPCPPVFGLLSKQQSLAWIDAVSELILQVKDGFALYQIFLQACRQDWHSYLESICNLVFLAEHPSVWKEDHGPSAYYGRLSKHIEEKTDKKQPFFAARARFLIAEQDKEAVEAIETLCQNFRYGGKPLYIQQEKQQPKKESLRLSHKQGMLLNQNELSQLFGLPSKDILEKHTGTIEKSLGHTLPKEFWNAPGIALGASIQQGQQIQVKFPDIQRPKHCHILGKAGAGKTTLMVQMALQDIQQGHGIALLDPHQDLYEAVLSRIPENRALDVILFDPCQNVLPKFNPLAQEKHLGKLADDMVFAVKAWLAASWGDRMENLFRQSFYALLCMPDACLGDLRFLLSRSEAGKQFRAKALRYIRFQDARQFWMFDYPKYKHEELDPVLNKLGKIFLQENLDAMFRQRENKYNFQEIIQGRKILLCNLSIARLGSTASSFLGSLLLALLHKAALASKHKKPFYMYIDELARFHTLAISDVLSEGRKFNLGLVAANQTLSQLSIQVRDALQNAICSIWFQMDGEDASLIEKKTAGRIPKEELLLLETGQAIARLVSREVDIRVPWPDNYPTGMQTQIQTYYRKHFGFVPGQKSWEVKPRVFDTF